MLSPFFRSLPFTLGFVCNTIESIISLSKQIQYLVLSHSMRLRWQAEDVKLSVGLVQKKMLTATSLA